MIYVLGVASILIFWLVFYDRPAIKMQFKEGKLVKQSGNIPHGFLMNCTEIANKNPFDGIVKVYINRHTKKLKFSKGVPGRIQQRIKNVFPHESFKTVRKVKYKRKRK